MFCTLHLLSKKIIFVPNFCFITPPPFLQIFSHCFFLLFSAKQNKTNKKKMDSATRRGPFCYTALQKKGSLRNLSSISSSSSMSSPKFAGGRKYYDTTRFEQQPHFLEACFLCNKPLGYNRDIFMYRSVFVHSF